MISVLIPIYNTDVRNLVTTLQAQLQKESIPFEILLLDDASLVSYSAVNRQLIGAAYCQYKERAINKGRLETRKELAGLAKYPWLLFLDSDCIIDSDSFIHKYIQILLSGNDVIVGGTKYISQKPKECEYLLHWKYAHQRISPYTTRAKKNCYSGFLFNNVIISKSLFKQLEFPKTISGYGHEDTWVGIELERRRAKLYFINNPILHLHLDKTELFLKKHSDALLNIKSLQNLADQTFLKQHIKIYKYHLLLKNLGLLKLFNWFLNIWNKKIERNLKSCQPSLIYFDLLRLFYLNKVMKN